MYDKDHQPSPGMGHNNPPAPTQGTVPFGLRAAWLRFADELELRRLAKLQVRIDRKQAIVAEMISERQKIMNRCIRRMRRANGKS